MSITTYAELQSAVSNWLHRSDLTSYTPDFITLAESEIFRRLRVADMENSFSSTMTTSGTIATPSGYLDLKHAYIDGTPVQWLERKSAKWIYQNYPTRSAERKPSFIAREGSNFIFGPYPDSQYTVVGVYYKNLGPLSTTLHAVFTNNPDLYLYGSLLAAVPFLKDDKRVPLWQAKYEQTLQSAQQKDDKEYFSGSDLRMVPA